MGEASKGNIKLTTLANSQCLKERHVRLCSTQYQRRRGSLGVRTFVQDHFVAKDDNIELAVRDEAVQDVPAGFASCLGVKGAYANDAPGRRLHCRDMRRRSLAATTAPVRRLSFVLLLVVGASIAPGAVAAGPSTTAEPSLRPASRSCWLWWPRRPARAPLGHIVVVVSGGEMVAARGGCDLDIGHLWVGVRRARDGLSRGHDAGNRSLRRSASIGARHRCR